MNRWPADTTGRPDADAFAEMAVGLDEVFRFCRRPHKHIVASGHFQGLHLGHFLYLEAAAALGTTLTVIVNSDAQSRLKKGFSLIDEQERLEMVKRMPGVTRAVLSADEGLSVSKTLAFLHSFSPVDVFANGGDVKEGCREEETCRRLGITCVYGVGGDKVNSSSELVRRAKSVGPAKV